MMLFKEFFSFLQKKKKKIESVKTTEDDFDLRNVFSTTLLQKMFLSVFSSTKTFYPFSPFRRNNPSSVESLKHHPKHFVTVFDRFSKLFNFRKRLNET